jgi:hypothetical protein
MPVLVASFVAMIGHNVGSSAKRTCLHSYKYVKVKKVKQFRYTPWRRLGREEIYLLLIHDLGTRWG